MSAQSDYERYVERYAKHHHISVEQAKEHALVKAYKEHRENEEEQGGGETYGWT